jgi:hypothetical protein
MKMKRIVLGLGFVLSAYCGKAQGIDGIIVEKYYVADAADVANATTNGATVPLTSNSVTYRVYVDMAAGWKFSLLKGNSFHSLKINTTTQFYNDPNNGVVVGAQATSTLNVRKNTVMIDSWLTTGGTAAGKVGVIESQDGDGSLGNAQSILANNPGGIYGAPINGAGAADGMISGTTSVPTVLGFGTAIDIFDQTPGGSFSVNNGAMAILGGALGYGPNNTMLLGQFTTNGVFTFELNIQLINPSGTAVEYVANSPQAGETVYPGLTLLAPAPPVVVIGGPSNLIAGNVGTYTATATDADGTVSSVQFQVDGVNAGAAITGSVGATYSYSYTATAGNHTICLIATDNDLQTGSACTTVTCTLPTPANVAFTTDNQTVVESIGTVTTNFTITASNALPSSVEVVLIPFGTATVGSDLAYTTQTVTFPANATGTQSIAITINDDALIESSEYFVLKFQNPVNAAFSPTAQQTIYIRDNENGTPIGNSDVSMNFVSSYSLATVTGTGTPNSAEIVAHDPISQRMFVANSIGKRLDIVDFSNPATMSVTASIDISSYGNINSVAVKNGIVACAIENIIPELDGYVVLFNTDGVFQKQVTVGALPDMITFNNAGTRILTANEGQPNVGYTIDPEGSVSIIDISGGMASLSQSNVTTALFTAFNGQMTSLKASGVRIYGPGATVAQDMEPEYIAVSEDDLTAYVTLQENNAMAYVNLTTNTITDIKPLGFKDYSVAGNGLDATDVGTNVNIANWPIKGMYNPDGMTRFNVGGVEYLITANEGDARADYGAANNEETSIGSASYTLDPTAFPYASVMKANSNLGKLKCTNKTGDTDNNGDFDEIYTFGARSFSIWNATTGALVYDSGDDLEQISANDPTYGAMFNSSNTNITKKNRSDDKGPEPEGVTVGSIGGNLYAFVSLERVGGLMAFNINNPSAPVFSQYVNNRGLTGLTGDRGPEGIIYIKQQDSPNGKALIVLGNEISSTISVYEIACPAISATLAAVSNTSACDGNTITVTTSTISGASYTWYNGATIIPGATSATYNATVSGNYSAKLNNIGCTVPSNSVTLVFNTIPTLSVTSSSSTICAAETLTLNVTGASSYTWTSGNNNATYTVSPLVNTVYSVTGTDANNCTNTSSISIAVNATPTVVTTADLLSICPGAVSTISVTGATTYTWTDNSNATTYTVSPTVTTTYSVMGSDLNGCKGNSTITVTLNPNPSISIVASNSVICLGNSATLTAIGANSYSWTSGPNTDTYSVSPTVNSTYTVTGTNTLTGCSNNAVISLTVNNTPTISVTASNNTICAGQTTTISANGASTYSWVSSGNITNSEVVSPITNTNYSVIGTDNGCSATASIQIVANPIPTISVVSSNTLICDGEAVTLTANTNGTSYVWSNAAITSSISVSPSVTTVYSVSVSDGLCSANSSITQSVSACTALNQIDKANDIRIYPNPFNHSFEVSIDGDLQQNNTLTIDIYNVLGENVYSQKALGSKAIINTTDLGNGTYFIKVNNKVYKIIKQN